MNTTAEGLESELRDFNTATGISVSVFGTEGATLCKAGAFFACTLCKKNNEQCLQSHQKAGECALRFGGRYIYLCPSGFVHTASPVLYEGKNIVTAVAGPMLMIDKNDYYDEYIKNALFSEEEKENAKSILETLEQTPLDKVTAVSNMLYYTASYSSGKDAVKLLSFTDEGSKQRGEISESIISLKKLNDGKTEYPINKEKELLDSLSLGDIKSSQRLLNEILGYIFFSTGGDTDIIKTRVVELIVQLSRAAIMNSGAGTSNIKQKILDMSVDYMKTIWQLETIDDISTWMSRIMSSFTQMIFSSKDIKHIDVIQKVVAFINLNYMHRLSLNDIASEVFLSSSYLSKIFKAEMKVNLSTYLNNVRIEKSRIFLLDSSVGIADVALMAGFEEQSYYSKVFKSVTGVSPGKYRQLRGHI